MFAGEDGGSYLTLPVLLLTSADYYNSLKKAADRKKSWEEAAECLGEPVETVKRALRKLKVIIAQTNISRTTIKAQYCNSIKQNNLVGSSIFRWPYKIG